MIVVHPHVLVLVVAVLAAGGCAASDEETIHDGTVVFSVFHLPAGGCGGIWAVDGPDDRPRLIVGRIEHQRRGTLDPNYPRFTPDGRSLLFAHFGDTDELPELDVYRMDTRSGRVQPVFARAIAFLYRWAADAPALVTARGDELVVVDAATGRVRELGRGEGPDYALDPRGRRLAHSRRNPEGRSLWVRAVDSGSARMVAQDGQWPFWSRDGQFLAYFPGTAIDDSPVPLRVVPADGGDARKLVDDAMVGRVLWTDDEVLFLRSPGERADGTEFGVGDLRAVEVSGGDTRSIAEEVLPLEVSPDGRRLLILRPHVIEGELFFTVRTMRLDGEDERVLGLIDEEDVNIGSTPTWQPQPHPVATAKGKFAPSEERSERCGKEIGEWRDRLADDF